MISRFSHATVTAVGAAVMLLAAGTVHAAQASTGPAAGRAAPGGPDARSTRPPEARSTSLTSTRCR